MRVVGPWAAPVRPASKFWVTVPGMSGSGHWTSLTSTFLSLILQPLQVHSPRLSSPQPTARTCACSPWLVGCMQFIPLNNALPWSVKIAENDWECEYMKPAMSQSTTFYFQTLTLTYLRNFWFRRDRRYTFHKSQKSLFSATDCAAEPNSAAAVCSLISSLNFN